MTQEVDEVEQQSHISVTMGGKESNLEIMLASELINGAKKTHTHTRGFIHLQFRDMQFHPWVSRDSKIQV